MERPCRAVGYPVLPAIYLVMAVFIELQPLRFKPQFTWPGLIIVLLGVPVYMASVCDCERGSLGRKIKGVG
jgi:basic amino acid/polyamine antiporter, APA family